MTRVLDVFNLASGLSDSTLGDYCRGVQRQLNRELALDWGLEGFTVRPHPHGTKPPTQGPGWIAAFLDNADQANALGYHGEGPAGLIFQRVFVQTSRRDGIAESSVFSHEGCEAAVDPTINLVADDGNGKGWAVEVGDPVQRDSYKLNVGHGVEVEVSNYATRNLFDPTATDHFDRLRKVTQPFGGSPGGYMQWTSDLTSWQSVGEDLYAAHDRPLRG